MFESYSIPGAPTDFDASFFLKHAVPIISPLYIFILHSSYKKRKKDFLEQLCTHQLGTAAPLPTSWYIFVCVVQTGHVYAQYNHPPCMTGLAPLRSGCFCICPPHLVFYPEFFSFWNAARCVHGRGYPICISSPRDVNSSAATERTLSRTAASKKCLSPASSVQTPAWPAI